MSLRNPERLAGLGRARGLLLAAVLPLGDGAIVSDASSLLAELSSLEDGSSRRVELLEDLEAHGIESLRPCIETALHEPDPSTRRACLDALGVLGTERDYDTALRAAAPAEGVSVEPELARRLEDCIASILRRHEGPSGYYFSLVEAAPAGLRAAVVRATSATPCPEAVRGLVELAGAQRDSVGLLLSQARSLLPNPVVWDAPERTLATLRDLLESDDPQRVREAATTLALLGDGDCAELLVEHLESGVPAASRAAYEALLELTGLELPLAPDRWRSWLASERAWLDARALLPATAVRRSREEMLADRLERLRELGRHRLERHELAIEVRESLHDPDVRVRRAAVDALGQLGAPISAPWLAEALDDPDATVVRTAHAALRCLVDTDLPPDAAAWRARLPGDPWHR